MPDDTTRKLEYFELLKTRRQKWNNIWDELAKYVCPQNSSSKDIFDSCPIWAREQLASGLQSLLVNPGRQWFYLKQSDGYSTMETREELENEETEEAELRMQYSENIIAQLFNSPDSNFYNQVHEFFLNLTAFGTGIFYLEEEPALPYGVFFRNISLRECYFEEDRLGRVNSMYRLFTMSPEMAANKWADFAPFKDKAIKNDHDRIEILHIVTPADGKTNKTSSKYPYSSQYIYLSESKIISESGYSYFPFLVTRWIKEEGDSYGYAPGHHVLPDIKLLNSLRQLTLKIAQKQLDPPLLVPKDGYHLPLYTSPGSVNFYRSGVADKIIPLSGMENIFPTHSEQNQCRDAILKAFYVDIFRMQKENKEMTATEVQVRTEEQYRMMAPMTGRIETEFLSPLIRAVYSILLKYNKIDNLNGNEENNRRADTTRDITKNIDIEYVSPLAKAQSSYAISSIEQVVGFFIRSGLANIAPDIYDNIDFDSCFRLCFTLRGAPQEILRSKPEVAKIRQQRKIIQLQQMQGNNGQV